MSELRRTAIGSFHIEGAVTLAQLDDLLALQQVLRPTAEGVRDLPQVKLDTRDVASIKYGNKLQLEADDAAEIAAVDDESRLVAHRTALWAPPGYSSDPRGSRAESISRNCSALRRA